MTYAGATLTSSVELEYHRLTYDNVMQMYAAGVLDDLQYRVELIDGFLVELPKPSPGHSGAVSWLTRFFVTEATALETRIQDVLVVEGGFFLPDVAVMDPPGRTAHPHTAHLVVEVSVTTQKHDRWKAPRYAQAGVAEYWNLDEPKRTITVYRNPTPDGYLEQRTFLDGETITPHLDIPDVDVSELLG